MATDKQPPTMRIVIGPPRNGHEVGLEAPALVTVRPQDLAPLARQIVFGRC